SRILWWRTRRNRATKIQRVGGTHACALQAGGRPGCGRALWICVVRPRGASLDSAGRNVPLAVGTQPLVSLAAPGSNFDRRCRIAARDRLSADDLGKLAAQGGGRGNLQRRFPGALGPRPGVLL